MPYFSTYCVVIFSSVDVFEIIPHLEFDIDSNGIVSEEEAKVGDDWHTALSDGDKEEDIVFIFLFNLAVKVVNACKILT